MRLASRLFCVVLLSLLAPLFLTTAARAASAAQLALDRTTPSIKLESIAFKDVIAYVEDISGANVHVDWKALEAAGVGKDAVVTMHLRSVSLRKALSVILSDAAGGTDLLTFYVSDNVIEITTRDLADKIMVTRVYPIDDLLVDVPDFEGPTFDLHSNNSNSITPGGGGGSGSSAGSLFGTGGTKDSTKTLTRADKAQQIIDLITSIVRPDVWQTNGGRATIRFFNGSLIITAPRSVHEAIDGPVD